ncbi:MAG: hypothetical protein WC829_17275 [Hyphomicrobium sp.]|jgi:hypothetical protein
MKDQEARLAQLVIELARENRSYAKTSPEIVKDARALLKAADAARAAVAAGRSSTTAVTRARRLMEPYRIGVIDRGDLRDVVLGLEFPAPHYLSRADRCFKLS